MKKCLASRLLVLPLAILLSVVPVFADTVRLKDGSVLRGQVIGFKDQQFTILLGGARGRRSRIMVYMEDVESIEFDSATTAGGCERLAGRDDFHWRRGEAPDGNDGTRSRGNENLYRLGGLIKTCRRSWD